MENYQMILSKEVTWLNLHFRKNYTVPIHSFQIYMPGIDLRARNSAWSRVDKMILSIQYSFNKQSLYANADLTSQAWFRNNPTQMAMFLIQ